MEQESESPGRPLKDLPSSVETGENEAAAPLVGLALDFHSAEFNQIIDELNDWSGNYRSFQPLDGVITADMRHQMERRPVDLSADETKAPEKTALVDTGSHIIKAPGELTVISRGRTLIVDTEAGRAAACAKRLSDQRLTCTLIITKKPSLDTTFPGQGQPALIEAEDLTITGTLGGFSAIVTIKGDQKNLTEGADDQAAYFDLVLDLQPDPSYAGDLLPLGYYAPGPDPVDLEAALAEMPEMRGRFKKPQFVIYQEDRCIHGRSRKQDCTSCLEICPFGAISSKDRKIVIDHHLCQGCGGCTLVCPSEAVRLNEPSQEALLKRLQNSLQNRSSGGDLPATLIISDGENKAEPPGPDEDGGDQPVYFEVEQIAHAGLEMPLAALAYGAGEVLIVYGSQNSSGIKKAVEHQMQIARTILRGLGLSEDKIRFVPGPPENVVTGINIPQPFGSDRQALESSLPQATFSPGPDKRRLVRLAAQHLYNQSGVTQPILPLPPGSPFGAVSVDHGTCTLCLACVSACPSRALSSGGQEPVLKFQESFCHQCGLCQETCPERAIQLHPRFFCDLGAVETPVILYQVEPFRCVECGRPFTTPTMIDRMQKKLLGHWMYTEERQLRRLRMCGTCRTRDALKSEDMRLWNLK